MPSARRVSAEDFVNHQIAAVVWSDVIDLEKNIFDVIFQKCACCTSFVNHLIWSSVIENVRSCRELVLKESNALTVF